ncbi:hypothetical protein CMUS01_04425 [Colletotrichum musicola]|uniref:Uncharacterized protein n=1 Tax=Colletotrichum musicola TaxID=2175873 RepID=A0A8H6KWI6_9PEZI|nr:hypothetical protein CMUS01_04425 [Colletotrichum musicola]
MYIGTILAAALMPYVAFARFHGSCFCSTDINAQCQKTACSAFGNGHKIGNIPSGYNTANVATTWREERCYTETVDGRTFNGIDGDTWEAQCKQSCNTGSKCT